MANTEKKTLTEASALSGITGMMTCLEDVTRELAEVEGVQRAMKSAVCRVKLRQAMMNPDAVAVLMELQGKPDGFRHDRESKGQQYSPQEVVEAAISAGVQGAFPVASEFTIFKGRAYLGQAFYERQCKTLPGISDLRWEIDIAQSDKSWPGILFLGAMATCHINGFRVTVEAYQSSEHDRRIAVTTYDGDLDNASGKAKKRILEKLYERLTAGPITEDSVSEMPVMGPQDPEVMDADPEQLISELTLEPSPPKTAPPSLSHRTEAEVDWKTELYSHGGPDTLVVQIGRLLHEAPEESDRQDVLKAAKASMVDGKFDQRAYDTLERYAYSRRAVTA